MPQQQTDVSSELADFADVLEETETIIKQCFKQYKLNEVFLSFNGGKDCTVLLDITIKLLRNIYKCEDIGKDLKVVYIRTNDPFNEIEEFVKLIEEHYSVRLNVVNGEMRTSLQRILDEDDSLKACLMGTRRTDPFSQDLKFMQHTDHNWPSILRVSPLLNWSYQHIWSYLINQKVPYCSLYDKGYTSIGSTKNTWPNPALAYKDHCGCLSYLPAWRLSDATLERAGRGAPPTSVSNGHDASNNDNTHSNGDVH
ncbi:FAD synthase-like [Achroia grisella]|uniref:FAD synthase-like n=1 Tax=Achroia grisella TaxID=688607 RepID=UPI0027D29005|nr:FAD synthase-like [Achroia grisella]